MQFPSLLGIALLHLFARSLTVSASAPPSPVPILPRRDVVLKPELSPSLHSPENALSSWASWPQFPSFGQPWPNTFLTLPSLFPVPAVSAESPPIQRAEEERRIRSGREEFDDQNNATSTAIELQQQFVGIRARFNAPVFEEIARLFYSVFNNEAQHINIRSQKQCFPEGCFRLHTFRIVGFQRPRAITLKPLGPNLLLLNILSFDVDIESMLNGNVQLLLTIVPVTGNFLANTRQLSIVALFDLQKDQKKVPYLRMASCELRSGSVSTKVSNLGLITDSINLKYKTEMLEKARELITSTICETISDTIKEQVNQMLRRLPRAISVATILGTLSPEQPPSCPSPVGTAGHTAISGHGPAPPLAFQMDSPQQHFYSNQLTVAYAKQSSGTSPAAGRGAPQFWSRRRQRRGMELIEEEADPEPKGKGSVTEITGETNRIAEKLERKAEMAVGERQGDRREVRLRESGSNKKRANCTAGGLTALVDFLDLQSLAKVFVDLDFMDSSAGPDFFAVGLSGDVFLRLPHQVSYVGGGVREVLAVPASSWERSNETKQRRTSASAEEEDKSLLSDLEEQEFRQQQFEGKPAVPFPPFLRFPSHTGPVAVRKGMEVIFSDLTANLLLLQAHRSVSHLNLSNFHDPIGRAKLLKVRIGPQSTLFGPMLKTVCGPDEVCLGDSVPEAAEKYPEEQLEVEVEPVQPPRVKFSKDMASLSIIGAATFHLARNGQPIARIPFTAVVELAIRNLLPADKLMNSTNWTAANADRHWGDQPGKLEVSLAIPKLEILEDVDFFELPASMLDGFRDAVRGAIVNSVAKALGSGVSLESLEKRLCPWGISQPGIQLLRDGLVLLSAELDAYTLLFENASASSRVDPAGPASSRPKCAAQQS